MSTEFRLNSVEDLEKTLPLVLDALAGSRKIALYGEMGAGKTTFVKAFCKHLGVQGNTASPTFSLVNQYFYKDADGHETIVRHLDLYRLRTALEALDIGIEDMLHDPSAYCIIEWPQLVEPIFPPDMVKIEIEVLGENERNLKITRG